MKAVDLFCCQGGASTGIVRAGWSVTGVDVLPQPRYPYNFIEADAMAFEIPAGVQFVWASPPCQHYSITKHCHDNEHADLIPQVRENLREWARRSNGVYVIENVVGAPLLNAIELSGPMFGLNTYRRRRFESNLLLLAPRMRLKRGQERYGDMVSLAGNGRSKKDTVAAWSAALGGCPWMTKKGMAQAIPPAYSEFLARQVMQALHPMRAAA